MLEYLPYIPSGIAIFISGIAIFISIRSIKISTKSKYYQQFITRLDALSVEMCSYSCSIQSEQKCHHYLKLIYQPQNNHICNQSKQEGIYTCCTEIRHLLQKLSNQNTKDKNSIMANISQLISDIEATIKDFCYK